MNKEKKLTIKYFIEQKVVEIGKALGIGCLVVPIPYYIGLLTNRYLSKLIEYMGLKPTEYVKYFSEWALGIGIMMTMLGIIISILLICTWIESNWERASKRAKKELK